MKTKIFVGLGLALVLCVLSASADGVISDGNICPTIADHHKWVQEIGKGNVTYENPNCTNLVETRFKGPFQRKKGPFGSATTEYLLVEVRGHGRQWIPSHWVEMDKAPSTKKVDPVVAGLLQSLSDFEETLEKTYRFHRQSGDVAAWMVFSTNWNRHRKVYYDNATRLRKPMVAIPFHDLFSLWQEMDKAVKKTKGAQVTQWRKTAKESSWSAYRINGYRPKSIEKVQLGRTSFLGLQKRYDYSAKFLPGTNSSFGVASFTGSRFIFIWRKDGKDKIIGMFPQVR